MGDSGNGSLPQQYGLWVENERGDLEQEVLVHLICSDTVRYAWLEGLGTFDLLVTDWPSPRIITCDRHNAVCPKQPGFLSSEFIQAGKKKRPTGAQVFFVSLHCSVPNCSFCGLTVCGLIWNLVLFPECVKHLVDSNQQRASVPYTRLESPTSGWLHY